MPKVSMAQAAKMFAVSRPSLAKHLKSGKISGEKTDSGWQLDTSELARVYPLRKDEVAGKLHDDLPEGGMGASGDLQAEIRVLQAKLEAAEKLAEERGKHLEDLRRLLPGPDDRQPRVLQLRAWPWLRRKN